MHGPPQVRFAPRKRGGPVKPPRPSLTGAVHGAQGSSGRDEETAPFSRTDKRDHLGAWLGKARAGRCNPRETARKRFIDDNCRARLHRLPSPRCSIGNVLSPPRGRCQYTRSGCHGFDAVPELRWWHHPFNRNAVHQWPFGMRCWPDGYPGSSFALPPNHSSNRSACVPVRASCNSLSSTRYSNSQSGSI